MGKQAMELKLFVNILVGLIHILCLLFFLIKQWKCNSVYMDKQGFSVLASDCPWKNGSLWSTMALYMFNLHIPLGYGGLSIVASLLEE